MKMYQRFGWVGLGLLAILVSFILQIVGSFIGIFAYTFKAGMDLAMQGITDEASIMAASEAAVEDSIGLCLILAHALMVLCFALWYGLGCGKPKLKEAKGVFAPKTLLVVLLVAGGMCFFTNFGLPVVEPLIPDQIMQNYIDLMEQAGFGVDTMAIIASVLLAPFGEELLCRGVVFYYGKKMVADLENRKVAFWIANTFQAVLFGVLHGNIVQGSYAFVMGLALGYLAHRFRSIIPSIIGHMLINAASTYVWEPIAMALPESYAVYAVGAVVCLVVVFVGLRIGGPAEQNGKNNYEAA